MPVWAFHGLLDETVPVEESVKMALNTSINSGFNDMQRAISEGQEKFNANQQASLNEANGYLRSISKTLQDAGHNEYIALKEANVSSYLRRIY